MLVFILTICLVKSAFIFGNNIYKSDVTIGHFICVQLSMNQNKMNAILHNINMLTTSPTILHARMCTDYAICQMEIHTDTHTHKYIYPPSTVVNLRINFQWKPKHSENFVTIIPNGVKCMQLLKRQSKLMIMIKVE